MSTAGLYNRLKKEIVDVHEKARKVLTGGKVDPAKIERETTKGIVSGRRNQARHDTYTSMDLTGSLLTGSLLTGTLK